MIPCMQCKTIFASKTVFLSLLPAVKPIINKTKLPSIVPVFRGYPVEIVCEAEGNPTPDISWNLGTTDIVYSETLTITESTPEDLHCIAINLFGSTIRSVKVSIQGNCVDFCIILNSTCFFFSTALHLVFLNVFNVIDS